MSRVLMKRKYTIGLVMINTTGAGSWGKHRKL